MAQQSDGQHFEKPVMNISSVCEHDAPVREAGRKACKRALTLKRQDQLLNEAVKKHDKNHERTVLRESLARKKPDHDK